MFGRIHQGIYIWVFLTGSFCKIILLVNLCVCVCVCVCVMLSCVQLFATPWTVACQMPLSMEFSRQEYWSGLPFPTPVVIYIECVNRQKII